MGQILLLTKIPKKSTLSINCTPNGGRKQWPFCKPLRAYKLSLTNLALSCHCSVSLSSFFLRFFHQQIWKNDLRCTKQKPTTKPTRALVFYFKILFKKLWRCKSEAPCFFIKSICPLLP